MGAPSLFKMAFLGRICLQQQTPSRSTRSSTSQRMLYSLSFQPEPRAWSLLPTSPQTTFREEKEKHTQKHSDPSQL